MALGYAEPPGKSSIILIAAVAAGVGAAVAALFPTTLGLTERVAESAAIIATLLFVAWVFYGGPERRVQRRLEREQRERIQHNVDLVDRLDALIRRGAAIFGDDTSHTNTFGYATQRAEQAVFGQINRSPSPTADEQKAAELAQQVRAGWDASSSARQQAFFTCIELLARPARTDSASFIEAYRLARSILSSNYSVTRSWLYWIRRGRPTRWNPQVVDDWMRFKEEGNRLAHEWELFGVEAGRRIGVEGPYNLPIVLDVILPGLEDLARPAPRVVPPQGPPAASAASPAE